MAKPPPVKRKNTTRTRRRSQVDPTRSCDMYFNMTRRSDDDTSGGSRSAVPSVGQSARHACGVNLLAGQASSLMSCPARPGEPHLTVTGIGRTARSSMSVHLIRVERSFPGDH
jgi:hypothetical protein